MTGNISAPKGMEIKTVTPSMGEEAAAVLAEAFRREETTVYLVNMRRPSAMRRMIMLKGVFVRLYEEAGRPVLAAVKDGRIVGVGMVRDPRRRVSWKRAAALVIPNLYQILALFAPRPYRALRILVAARKPGGLSKPHFTFEALGVHPQYQGKGVGRALMREMQALAEQDPLISGIYLNTGSERNRAFYERLGYHTIRVDDLGPVKIYHMFWRNPAYGLSR